MPIRRSPNGAAHTSPHTDRDRPERVIGINRNDCSGSIGTADRNRSVRSLYPFLAKITALRLFSDH
jgi:hypothetical protein